MQLSVGEILSRITTVPDMVRAFQDEDHCRHLLEAMVWPKGCICPACGYRRSTALMGRENGKRARPGLYQCSSGTCRFQFTVTTRTPLHTTKLPPRIWLSGLWLMLQSDRFCRNSFFPVAGLWPTSAGEGVAGCSRVGILIDR